MSLPPQGEGLAEIIEIAYEGSLKALARLSTCFCNSFASAHRSTCAD